MKKEYLVDMDREKIDYLVKLNRKLEDRLQSDLYESQMDWQYMDSKEIINDIALDCIEYHDNYNSFYYTLNEYKWRTFITNLDSGMTIVCENENYKYIMDKIKVLDNIDDPYGPEYEELENELIEKTKLVLNDIEEYLHTYEEYPDVDQAIDYALEMDRLEDYYINVYEDGTSDNVVRLDIAYTETFI